MKLSELIRLLQSGMNYLGDVDVLLADTKLNVEVSLRTENIQLISHNNQPTLLITGQPLSCGPASAGRSPRAGQVGQVLQAKNLQATSFSRAARK